MHFLFLEVFLGLLATARAFQLLFLVVNLFIGFPGLAELAPRVCIARITLIIESACVALVLLHVRDDFLVLAQVIVLGIDLSDLFIELLSELLSLRVGFLVL